MVGRAFGVSKEGSPSSSGTRMRLVVIRRKIDPPARSSGFRRPTKPSVVNQERSPGARPSTPVFHPLAYRSVVASWPLEWRELWGQRVNDLEETGLSWRDAETQAFVEVWHKLRQSAETATSSVVSTDQ